MDVFPLPFSDQLVAIILGVIAGIFVLSCIGTVLILCCCFGICAATGIGCTAYLKKKKSAEAASAVEEVTLDNKSAPV